MFRVTTLDLGQPLPKDAAEADFFGKEAFLTVSGHVITSYSIHYTKLYEASRLKSSV